MISLAQPIPFYLLLLFSANLGLFLPPIRFLAALFLVFFLPGYVLVERYSLWKNPLFAVVGALGLSFLLSPFITLPGCIIFQKVNTFLLIVSLDLFVLGFIWSSKGKERKGYPEKNHSPLLFPLLMLICAWVFVYLDITKSGPYCDDWTYLFGIVKELSRNMPPHDPEASSLTLKYPWFFYFNYALIHRLGGNSLWKIFDLVPPMMGFIFLGLAYMIILQATKSKGAGLGAILFLALGRESAWILHGIQGLGWRPFVAYDSWLDLQIFSGFSLLWGGWYLLPSMVPFLFSWFFLIRYHQEQQPKDYWFSWGTCAAGCFFHPAYYLGFMLGFSCWLLFQWARKRFDPWLLLFYFAFFPYFLTFFFYTRPLTPSSPIYQFQFDKKSIIDALRHWGWHNGLVIFLAAWASIVSREARFWILPFALTFAFLLIFGRGGINHHSHVVFPGIIYLSLLGAVGLAAFRKSPFLLRILIITLVLTMITPPFVSQVAFRLKTSWVGFLEPEQKAAGEFIRATTDENSTFVIFPESKFSIDCIEGLGERKVVFGWQFHLDRYESLEKIHKRAREVIGFYKNSNPETQKDFVRKYRVDYIFLGPDEVTFIQKNGAEATLFAKNFRSVYKSQSVQILKIDDDHRL
ncbi:MAG: hypothetical protein AB1585_14485 [Thermodesulfobacteriota bacterium]